jgi:hypothetical protein
MRTRHQRNEETNAGSPIALSDWTTGTVRTCFERSDKQIKIRQSSKIRELGDALAACGCITLDQQAKALGLGRSTTWTILKANHKASGLSAMIINRMLAAPQLPSLVRGKIIEYIDEKTGGLYGHNKMQIRRFTARLSVSAVNQARTMHAEYHEVEKQFKRPRLTLVALTERSKGTGNATRAAFLPAGCD